MRKGRFEVLVISDRLAEAEVLVRQLQRWGHTVHLASDGAQGLALVPRVKPNVIICQLNMPGMDGYHVLESIANNPETRNLPFFLMNCEWTTENWSRAVGDRNATAHLATPVSRDDLRGVVELTRRALEAQQAR